jgi:hypothetical protein
MVARMMRKPIWFVCVLGLAACSAHGQSPLDATPEVSIDSSEVSTDSPLPTCNAGAAQITGSVGTYDRGYAGAGLLSGPVAGPSIAGAPIQLQLLFANDPMIDPSMLGCCIGDASCCTLDTLVVWTDPVARGAELGDHAVTFTRTQNHLQVRGTLTITTFADPFATLPGMIGGTLHAAANGQTIDGDFGNEFCAPLLAVEL